MTPATVIIAAALHIGTPPPTAPPEPPPAATAVRTAAPVAFPHPLIVEILYAVPTGDDGDANGDGKRDAAGDEFIELVNPHDRPINLRGYKITDRNAPDQGQLRFVFPAVELPPGGVVVVFNGYGAKWDGPVGDSRKAPEAPHDTFAGARVLSMRGSSSLTSWANGGDWALLSDPSGAAVHCVWWGKFGEKTPETGLVEQAPLCTRSSITRDGIDGSWVIHADLEDVPFSPGRWGNPGETPVEPDTEDPAPALAPAAAPPPAESETTPDPKPAPTKKE